MSYCQRKNKHYKHPKPNATQTPQTRRAKYAFTKALTHNTNIANQLRDFRIPKLIQFITNYLNTHGANKK